MILLTIFYLLATGLWTKRVPVLIALPLGLTSFIYYCLTWFCGVFFFAVSFAFELIGRWIFIVFGSCVLRTEELLGGMFESSSASGT